MVIFDQFRGDYLARWDSLFVDDGFRRLMKDGAWYRNCHYSYANTETGPGHASLATGTYPSRHGIINNDWCDHETGELIYCAGSERYERVPPAAKKDDAKPEKKKAEGIAPDRLLVPTLADALKEATGGKARVVSLSCKDRSAVFPGGKQPDACYWLDGDLFVTSTYYRDKVHSWVSDFNDERMIDHWFGKDWIRLRPDLDYEKYSGPDDVIGEGKGFEQGRTFPHPTTGGLKKPGRDYFKAVYASPFGNDLLLELAKRAIDAEKLGTHDVPDLLCLGFSSNDAVGHVWGPDSQEVLDITLRTDLLIRDLLAYLDTKVGKGNYVLVMTADHGVCPLPEVSRRNGKDVSRTTKAILRRKAEDFLDETFAVKSDSKAEDKPQKGSAERSSWFEGGLFADDVFYPWINLNRQTLKRRGLKAEEVEEKLAAWFKTQPAILTAYTHSQLQNGLPHDDAIGQQVLRSYHPDRSGDMAIVVKPYCLVFYYLTGAGHGTPHPYDTYVPLLVYGAGVEPGVHKQRVIPQAAAVLLARLMGIKPPAAAEETLLDDYLDGVVPGK
jgi:hypothetical protein